MIDPALGRTLADIGGMALFLLHISVDGVGLLRKWWVPGWLYAERTAERDAAQLELKQATKTIGQLTLQLSRERKRRSSDPDA